MKNKYFLMLWLPSLMIQSLWVKQEAKTPILAIREPLEVVRVAEAATIENKTLKVWVTAYSSTPEETDDTPFITASNKKVRDGIVATNLLPFGTEIQIPELFGEKTFIVEDRMHRRKTNFIDVWMPTREAAEEFGINQTEVVILN